MPARTPLGPDAIAAALNQLDGWSADGDRIVKRLKFGSFREALAFLVRVGFEAEGMDHHPEITNVYDRVTLALATHDAGDKVTETDLELARRIDALPGPTTR